MAASRVWIRILICFIIISMLISTHFIIMNEDNMMLVDTKTTLPDPYLSYNLDLSHSYNLETTQPPLPIVDPYQQMQTLIEWSVHPKSFCFGNLSSDIVIVSIGDITNCSIPELSELSRLNKGYYAMKYNYVYCEFPVNVIRLRNPVYSKPPLILNVLKLYPFVIWMDFDVVAHWNSRSLDEILKIFSEDSDINAIFSSDVDKEANYIVNRSEKFEDITEDTVQQPPESYPPNYVSINTGIQLYRSCNWTFKFMDDWYYYFNKSDDQQAMHWYWYEHKKEWKKHIKVVKWNSIQFMGKDEVIRATRRMNSYPDKLLWHIAAGKWTWKWKQKRMRYLILTYTNQTLMEQYKSYTNRTN
eukprot:121094_1